ncbi:MAG: ATP-binding protein [Proteobacteria bacterium]|nr:ATP-binding protein [Pseudomonadota bacterium]MBU1611143.1 ATP-binding protein [Pseudomonadota bacterium]
MAMMKVDRGESDIRFGIGSELYLVDKIIEEAKAFVRSQGAEDTGGLILVLRELLNNAIEHGNHKDSKKKVEATVERIGPLRFKVTVADEGEGFDYKDLILKMSDDPTQLRNRGLPLVNAYCDELSFNAMGSQVEAYLTVPAETGFDLSEEDGWKVISPTGDITASVAEQFRSLLVALVEEGYLKYRFNLAKVMDIDSITLSIFVVFSNMLEKKGEEYALEIVAANADIEDVFNLTRLNNKYSFIQGE